MLFLPNILRNIYYRHYSQLTRPVFDTHFFVIVIETFVVVYPLPYVSDYESERKYENKYEIGNIRPFDYTPRSYNVQCCLFCSEESVQHLFECVVAKQCWLMISEIFNIKVGGYLV